MKRSSLLTTICATLTAGSGVSPALAKGTVYIAHPGDPVLAGQQLQDAVNDPANAGKIIHLSPGTYKLDPTKPAGGRLYLKQGMDILGENDYVDCNGDGIWDPVSWDPVSCSGAVGSTDQFVVSGSETVIDGKLVTTLENGAPTGLVRAGLDNTISRVTILGPDGPSINNVTGNIHINLHNNGLIRAVVTDNVIDGGARGIYCQNPPNTAGTSALVTLSRNVIRNIPNPGIQFINPNTEANIWEGYVEHNRIYSNRIGLFLLGNQSTSAQTTISSFRNLFELNRLGILVQAGQDGGGTALGPGNNNQFSLASQEDIIRNNTGPTGSPAGVLGGGVVAIAGANSTANRPWSYSNRAVVEFRDTSFEDNTDPTGVSHLRAFGYWTDQNRTVSDYPTDNQTSATVRLPDCDLHPPGFSTDDSEPDSYNPSNTNKAYLDFGGCPDPASRITIQSNFNGTPIAQGDYVWFSANMSASGLRKDAPTTIYFKDSTITINDQPYPVPNGRITFDPAASCSSTDLVFGEWTTSLPTKGGDEILISGLRLRAIDGIAGGAGVSWSGRFYSDQPGVTLKWKWSAAVYSAAFDYNAMSIKPTHANTCGMNNSDHAGTPEAMKSYLVGGARGGGGSNYTGGWSSTLTVLPQPY